MALPKIKVPTYSLELPSTGEKIEFRSFLVKEQKLLLIAQESDNEDEIFNAIKTIVESCTFGKIDATNSPLFDIEYIFIKMRGKSVGEKIKINVTCPDDEKTKVPVDVDLSDISVQMTVGHTNEVNLTEDIKLIMKYPILSDMKNIDAGEGQSSYIFDIMEYCIQEVHEGENVYNRVDISKKDMEEFVDQFTVEQLTDVVKFFETMPKIRHVVSVTNPNTKVKSDVVLEGMNNFLV